MRLSYKLTVLFLLLSLIPLSMVSFLNLTIGQQALEQAAFNRLDSITILKEAEVERWLEGNEQQLRGLASRPGVRDLAAILSTSDLDASEYAVASSTIRRDHLNPTLEIEGGFFELFILRASDGLILLSTDERQSGKYRDHEPYFTEGKSGSYVQNVYYSLPLETHVMAVSTPITDRDGSLIAVLAGHLDLTELSQIMALGSRLSSSERSYLVNRFNFLVTDPGTNEELASGNAIHTAGVAGCLTNRNGSGLYDDYRNVPVIGVYRWLPERELCLLAEVDQSEALMSSNNMQKATVGLGAVVAAIVAVIGVFFARSITESVQAVVAGAEAIGRGHLDYHIPVNANDEIGQLAQGFNQMAQGLKAITASRDELDREIADRERAEIALRESEERFRMIAEATPVPLVITHQADRVILYANVEFGLIHRMPVERVLGQSALNLYADPAERQALLDRLDQEGQVRDFKLRARRLADDTAFWANLTIQPVTFDGEPALFSAFTDITEQKLAEQAAERHFARVQLLLAITASANAAASMDEVFQFAIDRVCEHTGWPVGHVYVRAAEAGDELISSPIWHLQDTERFGKFKAETTQTRFALSGKGFIRDVFVTGQPRWIDTTRYPDFLRAEAAQACGICTGLAFPIRVRESVAAILEFFSTEILEPDIDLLDVMANISTQLGQVGERKLAAEERRAAETRFAGVLDVTAEAVIAIDLTQHIILFNSSAERAFGYSATEVLGQPLDILLPPGDTARHRQYVRGFAEGPDLARGMGQRDTHLHGRRKDGTIFPIEASVSKLTLGDQTILTVFLQDITKRRQDEEAIRTLNAELEQRVAERTAHLMTLNQELEAFSYAVSHDLRAPLRAIDGFSLALLEDYYVHLDDEGKEFIDIIRTESQRMGALIDDLLGLSRVTRSELSITDVDLSAIARNIAAHLQQQDAHREVEIMIQDNMTACADERLIRIALQNLIGNAWKFTGKKQQAQIKFDCVKDDTKVAYLVRDNGAGFDMAYVHKMFGAFQRLHGGDDYEGTGIGLATVQRIIHRHGGSIWAEGVIDEGATFYFTLGEKNCD
jgi:PAS domain S-box-containing protein